MKRASYSSSPKVLLNRSAPAPLCKITIVYLANRFQASPQIHQEHVSRTAGFFNNATSGVVAEWLSRKTRNLVPSGASVRIWPTSMKW
ncbi:uncharacterized protein K460DRAFT_361799 [Cucurbitaria berberidis CBS 394.84]|uniref:Uncharacterized protein n=1 Tax=Cucurbitaria berberidis CBS 394.84 TaxID=1168544 RepID=A0A9P4GTI4_9PLEO|nr:uncharacterized protein K460DRAFT_361799 [Cucurbitaria berberidis CBS 394.84]KAF1851052.1 hypothetical protein K460DRAFT_361799 [Cucurbitaria berberidis CBS 394.84]